MTAPAYYTKDGTNDGLEPVWGAGGALFTIGKAWNPSTLSYVSLVVDSSGALAVGGGSGSTGTSAATPVNVTVADPYSYVYTWVTVAGLRRPATVTRTVGTTSSVKTFSWDSVTGEFLGASKWV